jgi:Na+/melibiose symporter-like transporter
MDSYLNGRTVRSLGLALGIVAAIIWLPIVAAVVVILLAAILYRLDSK